MPALIQILRQWIKDHIETGKQREALFLLFKSDYHTELTNRSLANSYHLVGGHQLDDSSSIAEHHLTQMGPLMTRKAVALAEDSSLDIVFHDIVEDTSFDLSENHTLKLHHSDDDSIADIAEACRKVLWNVYSVSLTDLSAIAEQHPERIVKEKHITPSWMSATIE